ncbi:bifunctional [glutamate--ammonia ligase]-adenylyl-L-tyrosine phosphorylase/[glutamate--ammonia-ligase] adenylyltransferase [Kingella kingae]|uniref:bifunctional [glutamate--ammonia ligase]-adenylyl-L-tyrosine phosphorylase/[glutamate--ammonia-ligase] adenylyltransferase n=1 Tax=Kingella kingae TaxID=504 RepID=UPI0013DFC5C3|nr:bifunctional [glutamate--ammonia ligase]-adenylyl-L-tyrosine phosphorylase/[glutamate--ammonia-ligase] adenylyltransferase [Kingella kingae]MBD3613253.1 bifunctional [glutamate--ammonia ligase]-adenylyl-L-tyrosine phosphorylase/[glutamate--ammonia-ligase] adenylyltransferase [Kingella kingae]MBD3631597.1 bifunctional [glutamate--ammonia ligase]-adenylyl-L-tyrosine phosphorylase/[glutamate--ammonia-ligase] adenylyltransferase [Kingella kingae]MBD3658990.1 bifunctional [glutamate--ammonia ligas
MPLSTLYTATPYSQWLTLQLDNQRLNLDILSNWLSRPIMLTDFADFADWQHIQSSENEEELAKQLRLLRRNVMAHIMTRDLCRQSDLAEVTRTITELADFAINTALSFAYAYYVDMYGTPIGHYTQEPQQLSVVAMGKAGGFELNVSSDIDLIFIYPENGDTNGKRERTNQEFFTKVGQKLIALLDEITADGQVFRVDMRLRPDGDSGALVCSEAALEQYLVTQGREWERYAWCKGRVVTPFANDINSMIRPFVFRKYLDYNAYDAMRDLHRQIRQEVQKRGMTDNVKLGAGGIREVEFIAQIFQMIRGGQNRALQLKGTQETLLKLAELGILDNEVAQKLLLAYRFLRDVEHRLQYWDDQQTQTLPESESQQHLLAQSMGFATWAEFAGCLNEHRALVNQQFSNVLDAPDEAEVAQHDLHDCWKWNDSDGEKAACTQLARLGYADAERVVQRLAQLRQSTKYRQLSVQAALRFDAIVPRLLEAAARVQNSDNTLFRLLDFLETISRRSAYLAFLQQYPQALAQLADLMSQSAWLAAYLQRHPILLDELLSAQLMERLDWQALRDELASSLHACDDTEAKMDVLRHFQHAQTFRLTVQDLAGLWTVEALSDELSHLADLVLAQTLQHVWQDMPKTHCESPKFAIIGYGKLGGKELGYASDLDLVYLYEDDDANAIELYTKLSRRLSTWLSGSTGAGTLYDIDLRLRPNGDAGFLAHSLAAFDKYQHEQAWTWEHQSLTRGRFICGDTEVGRKFEQIRRAILTQPRDTAQLKRDIIEMREKMFATHPPVDDNVKYARGGVVDVEFIVQYLVLSQSHAAPELLENYGNITLLNMAAQRGLIDANLAEQCRAAYRHYRQQQHNKNLRDWQCAAVDSELLVHYEHVKTLWAQVFGEAVKMG